MAHLVVVDYFASALNSTLCTFAFMGSFLASNPGYRAEVVYYMTIPVVEFLNGGIQN